MFAMLLITLPTQPSSVRVRIWRALKAMGCASLRDGAYLLPEANQALFEPLADEVREHGGSAMVLRLDATNDGQRIELETLFDRGEAYGAWRATAEALHTELGGLGEATARRRWRGVAQALEEVQRTDYFPGEAALQAQVTLADLRDALDAHYSKGEPRSLPDHGIAPLDVDQFQGKRWATRARPWVDRLASAWLIARFIDKQPEFVWLADVARLPRGAIGFDFDGARFSHVGPRVTFEVLLASFGFDQDPRLMRIGSMVHCLDAGGIPVPEAIGLEAVLAGLREMHKDDDQLLAAASAVFDALLATPAEERQA